MVGVWELDRALESMSPDLLCLLLPDLLPSPVKLFMNSAPHPVLWLEQQGFSSSSSLSKFNLNEQIGVASLFQPPCLDQFFGVGCFWGLQGAWQPLTDEHVSLQLFLTRMSENFLVSPITSTLGFGFILTRSWEREGKGSHFELFRRVFHLV